MWQLSRLRWVLLDRVQRDGVEVSRPPSIQFKSRKGGLFLGCLCIATALQPVVQIASSFVSTLFCLVCDGCEDSHTPVLHLRPGHLIPRVFLPWWCLQARIMSISISCPATNSASHHEQQLPALGLRRPKGRVMSISHFSRLPFCAHGLRGCFMHVLSSCAHTRVSLLCLTQEAVVRYCLVPRWLRSMHVLFMTTSPEKDSAFLGVI